MVKIIDFKTCERADGSVFNVLILQGGLEAVTSNKTGQTYLTARKANLPCTFNETTCKSLIGTDLEGQINKIEVVPYQYTIPSTGETITLQHSYQYVSNEEHIVMNNLIHQEEVY